MWALEALKHDYRVALIAGGSIDLSTLNTYYGTAVSAKECKVIEIPVPWPLASADWGVALRGACVGRQMRRYFDRFDVLINCYNLGNFGRPAIHMLADFSWDEDLRRQLHPVPGGARGILHHVKRLRRGYLAVSHMIAGHPEHPEFRGAGIVLANSEWSRRKLIEKHGIDAKVLYPPVVMSAPGSSERRCPHFVCLGRISPEKRIERIITILERVRKRGHALKLRIIGDYGETAYGREIEGICRREGDWMSLEGRQPGSSKARVLAECAFGIHACQGESFGIAVAEMVKAGCVTFAPAEGGQAEIIDHDALLYSDEDEAVEKIIAVLKNNLLRGELSRHLRRQGEKFSAEKFMSGLREAVDSFLLRRPSGTERFLAGAT